MSNEDILKENVYYTYKQMERYEKALRFAAGMLSTVPQYQDRHPQEIFDMILNEVDADEQQ